MLKGLKYYSCTKAHKPCTQTANIKYKTLICILIYYYKLEIHAVAYSSTLIAGD